MNWGGGLTPPPDISNPDNRLMFSMCVCMIRKGEERAVIRAFTALSPFCRRKIVKSLKWVVWDDQRTARR